MSSEDFQDLFLKYVTINTSLKTRVSRDMSNLLYTYYKVYTVKLLTIKQR